MFAEYRGITYKILIEEFNGAWVIMCAEDSKPEWVERDKLNCFQRIPTPEWILENRTNPLTPAQSKRLELIKPLLDDTECITDRRVCIQKSQSIAEEHSTTAKRIRHLFYRYLSLETLTSKKQRESKKKSVFDWAIRKYYFSAKQPSLRQAYESMLLLRFTSEDGGLNANYPSFDSFRHYYYRRLYHKEPQKHISRKGLSDFQRNERILKGSAMLWRTSIGCYQMDATMADIYLVSQFNRTKVAGRPYIYLAVDTATQLIAGVFIGYESGEPAVLACLTNAVQSKVEVCKKYGITITEDSWPSLGYPSEIITDNGREFMCKSLEDICIRFGTELHVLPPFRPDEKSLVERMFGYINDGYKPLLRGKGVIEADATERWSIDYRKQATLTLREFTAIIYRHIIHLNSKRVLENVDHLPAGAPRVPSQLWRWYETQGKTTIIQGDAFFLYILSLPRDKGTISRTGLSHKGLSYNLADDCPYKIGDTVTYAYDIQNTDFIYIIDKGKTFTCPLSTTAMRFQNSPISEVEIFRKNEREVVAKLKKQELESRIHNVHEIQEIIKEASNNQSEQNVIKPVSLNKKKR